jgi:hypothetical protein
MSARSEQQLEELLDALRSFTFALGQSSKTKQSVELLGAIAIPFTITAGQTDGQLRPTRVQNVLLGWSIRETSTVNPATLIFRDGGQTTDDEVACLTLAASESDRDIFPHGIALSKGLYLDVQAGAIAGVVYLGNPS